MIKPQKTRSKMTTYDEIPYPIYAHVSSAPENLAAIALLFGMKPHDVENSRVLEIGCASGGNMIPLAARHPKATFVGVDLSKAQIELAQKTAQTLHLDNVKFYAKSILDFEFKSEKFDFIIAHGVYSWVREDVQKRILEICSKNLSEKGIAYISYNTLPGWNSVKTIRDMMLYHGQKFSDPAQKVQEARKMLNFVSENIQEKSGAHKIFMEQEIKTVQSQDDNFVLHDYLEETNVPCYFYEFMDLAQKYGLQYLGDSDLPSMYLGNHTDTVSKTLMQLDNNINQEQYLDFINNRKFRSTLLVHEGVELKRNIDLSSIEDLSFLPNYVLKDVDLSNIKPLPESLDLVGIANSDAKLTLKGRSVCACYLELLKAMPVPQTLDELVVLAKKNLNDDQDEDIRATFGALIPELVLKGAFSITMGKPGCISKISEKPEVFAPARLQALDHALIANMLQQNVKLTDDQRLVIQYVDGQNTIEKIVDLVRGHVDKGELTLNRNDKPLESGDSDHKQYLLDYIHSILALCAANALIKA